MTLNRNRIQQQLKEFDFAHLFNEIGWDNYQRQYQIPVKNISYSMQAVAEKRGMVALICPTLPEHAVRAKLEREVAKTHRENIIIYVDEKKTRQIWQWVRREAGKPLAMRERTYYAGQPGESIVQMLSAIAFSLDEEENLTIVDVTGRVRATFDVERVTKHFYVRFKREHDTFLQFIQGIPDEDIHRWYASVMLNRLMFIYFVQKKDFLDNDSNYLSTKLAQTQGNYYRDFLCPLFFEGFALKSSERSAAMNQLLGDVPYLNGGLFAKHQIENQYGDSIQIENAAFQRLFDFFDGYHWHLDERPLRDDNEINPDVLGYIFRKYINQKQMGAYYTKEDITEYISKNTVIPYLFDVAVKECRVAFEGDHTVWDLLQETPERYIYPAVWHGADLSLPDNITTGVKHVSQRTDWNTPAPTEYALPTEIWREVVARRQRYSDVRTKLVAAKVRSINDLITYNLDIQQFAQDVIDTTDSSDLLRAFWKAINNVTVLDPTCGSGAFLFSALNILEPLYEACLERMEGFIAELERAGETSPKKYSDFRAILAKVNDHPNRRYFILKSIIVNNLFGVDIMEEAVEICKLRLFLKLVAQLDDKRRIEPLPDIDFNIQAGNTLVGFATLDELKRAVTRSSTGQMRMLTPEEQENLDSIQNKAADIDRLFKLFRQQQTELGGEIKSEDKTTLKNRLRELDHELNELLARQYNADIGGQAVYDKWLKSHQPFHWLIEFFGVLKDGGFNVIIGNPPYVEYRKVRNTYKVLAFSTEDCEDLYAFCMERSLQILASSGYMGMIVPVSIVSTDGFNSLRDLFMQRVAYSWASHYAERPSKLFTGVEKRLTIWLSNNGKAKSEKLSSSNYRRWFSEERGNLFATLNYVPRDTTRFLVASSIPKIYHPIEKDILNKLLTNKPLAYYFMRTSNHFVYYTRKLRYFVQFFDFVPRITDNTGNVIPPSELKEMRFASQSFANAALAALNSSLFFWFLTIHSDVRNVNKREMESFPLALDKFDESNIAQLGKLASQLMEDFKFNSRMIANNYANYGLLNIQSFQPRLSKPIIDEIDLVLARHYDFTEEELDFIINYDIKYRMGDALAGDEGEGEE